ncbi:flagellar hook-basal body complex protein, partial [Methylobacterium frigidaeris]
AANMTLMGYSLLDGEPNPTLNDVTDMVPINLASVSTRATPTTEASLSGKLPLEGTVANAGEYSKKYSLVTYDKLGKAQTLDVYLSKNTGGTWTASIYNAASSPTPTGTDPTLPAGASLATATLGFDAQGRLAGTPAAGTDKFITLNTAPAGAGETITLDFSGLNQLAGDYGVEGKADGKPPAAVTGSEFGSDGTVYATFDDGSRLAAFKVPLATVKSPDNLEPRSGNVYRVSVDSGDIQVGFAGQNGRGAIKSGALEQSNVDVSTELTAMIESQSVYTANSKVFTTGNEMLDTLMNLKR